MQSKRVKRSLQSPVTSKKEWIQYKNNPHIQKNTFTKEFKCKTCNKKLNANPGGVALHCRSSHGVKIDGSPLFRRELAVERAQKSTVTQRSRASLMYEELFTSKHKPSDIPNTTENYSVTTQPFTIPLHQISGPVEIDRFEEKKKLWKKYIQARKDGYPEKFLKILQDEMGLDDEEIEIELKRWRASEEAKIVDFFEGLLKRGVPFEDAQLGCSYLYFNLLRQLP